MNTMIKLSTRLPFTEGQLTRKRENLSLRGGFKIVPCLGGSISDIERRRERRCIPVY